MINAGILDGDMVLVQEEHTAENGDMVVALIEDGATVKTFYREEGIIRLQPENDFMDPIIVKDVPLSEKSLEYFASSGRRIHIIKAGIRRRWHQTDSRFFTALLFILSQT